jgi:hypothetical protein
MGFHGYMDFSGAKIGGKYGEDNFSLQRRKPAL